MIKNNFTARKVSVPREYQYADSYLIRSGTFEKIKLYERISSLAAKKIEDSKKNAIEIIKNSELEAKSIIEGAKVEAQEYINVKKSLVLNDFVESCNLHLLEMKEEKAKNRKEIKVHTMMILKEIIYKLNIELNNYVKLDALIKIQLESLVEDDEISIICHPDSAQQVRKLIQRNLKYNKSWSIESDPDINITDFCIKTDKGKYISSWEGIISDLSKLLDVDG